MNRFAGLLVLVLLPTVARATTISVPVPAGGDTVWTIERGLYSGMQMSLRLDAAFGERGQREHFWRLPLGGGRDAGVVGWKTTRYPIPVAFRHSRESDEIFARDSVAFWAVLREMHAAFGIALFRPVTIERTEDPTDVIVIDVRFIGRKDGLSLSSWTASGELFDVRVTFRDAAMLHDAHVVTHEMMHALGFGHTTAWRSIVNPWELGRLLRLTPEDVAYAELAMRLRERREHVDMRRLIALAVERESPQYRGVPGYDTPCARDDVGLFRDEEPMRKRALLPAGLLTVVSGCAVGDRVPDTNPAPGGW